MTNNVRILEECGENTLVLFDELGAGTDPTEGAALAISMIEYARRRGTRLEKTDRGTHAAQTRADGKP